MSGHEQPIFDDLNGGNPEQKPFWQGEGTELEFEFRKGMREQWVIETLKSTKGRPLSSLDFAKILYAEEFDNTNRKNLTIRASNYLKRGNVLRDLRVSGLDMYRTLRTNRNGRAEVRIMCSEPNLQLSDGDFDEGKRLSDEELFELSVEIRRRESIRQREMPRKTSDVPKSRLSGIGRREYAPWVDTDGTEFFLEMQKDEDPVLKLKLQAREILISRKSDIHPAILQALAAGVSLSEVAHQLNIPGGIITANLEDEYNRIIRLEV